MYGARGFESRKGSTRTNNPTPASCRNAASGEWPNRDRVVGCSTANGLHDRGAGRRKSIKSKPFGSRPTYPAPHDAEPARIAAGARRPITKPVAGRSAAASTRDTAGSHDSRPGLAMIVQVTRRPFPGCGSRHRRPWSGHGAVPRRRRKSALAAPSYPLRSAHSIERIEWPTSYRKYQERRLLVSLVARAPPCLPHATPHQPSGACWAPT